MLRILTEASGSLTSGYIIKAIKDAGYYAIASDVDERIASKYLADDFIKMPFSNDPQLWDKTLGLLGQYQVDVVFPSFDETLVDWALQKKELLNQKVHIILSDPDTIKVFRDKWLTYSFFKSHNIPTPKTSTEQIYSLVKPRAGRGGKGVHLPKGSVSMEGMISQEYVEGEEYTVDVLCDRNAKPVYIVPRVRWNVKDGKSTGGIVRFHRDIISWVERICAAVPFVGPINLQCFVLPDGTVQFIEINPRLAGGMALGFAATDNWISAIVQSVVYGEDIKIKPVQYGMKMLRYYDEIYVPSN